jgi:hypothetical protein
MARMETTLSFLEGRCFERPNWRSVYTNVWQVLSQSLAAWRLDGGTGGKRITSLASCK